MGKDGFQRPPVDYARTGRANSTEKTKRLLLIWSLFFLVIALLFFLLHDRFDRPSQGPEEAETDVPPVFETLEKRKNIYDRKYKELAVSFQLVSIYAKPLELANIKSAAGQLASVLGRNEDELYSDLKAERSYEWLGRHVDPVAAAEVAALNLAGIYFVHENKRFYPNNKRAAHVLGFVKDEQGLAGIESRYDVLLHVGMAEKKSFTPDGNAESGHLILSLDLAVQSLLEEEMSKLVKETGAKYGMAAVMEPESGAILALVNVPAFDPNRFWMSSPEALENRLTDEMIDPGGLSHLFHLAQAIRGGLIKEEETEAFSGRCITPRKMKKIVRKSAVLAWLEGDGGLFLSGEIAALVASDGVLAGDRAGGEKMSGLSLLREFSLLVNGGVSMEPYILEAVAGLDGVRKVTHQSGAAQLEFKADMSRRFTSALDDTLPPLSRFFFAESLQPLQSVDSALLEVVRALKEESGGGVESIQMDKEYRALMLGMAPAANAKVSFFVGLEGARIDLTTSPIRRLMSRFLDKALKTMQASADFTDRPPAVDEIEMYQRWMEDQKGTVRGGGSKIQPDVMPDLCGFSLRKALQVLQSFNMKIIVRGSGSVRQQEPGPGRKVTGEKCVLVLEPLSQKNEKP